MTESADVDIALTFLLRDEPLAQSILDEFQDRANVYLYSDRQGELAGSDGMDNFSQVFQQRARICVVLYRDGWGKTRWTGIEETAIKNRWMARNDWHFLVLISLDGTAPGWVPLTHVWLDWERFGMPALIAVVERKFSEQGSVRQLGVVELAGREERRKGKKERQANYLNSGNGAVAADREVASLFEHLANQVAEIARRAPGLRIAFRRRSTLDWVGVITSPGYSVTIGWSRGPTARLCSLFIAERAGPYLFDNMFEKYQVVSEFHVHLAVDESDALVWTEESSPGQLFTSKAFGDRCIEKVVNRAQDESVEELEDNRSAETEYDPFDG